MTTTDVSNCLVWQMYCDDSGYGVRFYKGRKWKVHRAAWDEQVGPIPDGVYVLHTCDNPPCYNVDHLFLGTQADNVADMARKGRHGRSTLTNAQCLEIRARRQAGDKVHALAAEYGVTPGTISRIANGVRRVFI